MKRLMPWLIVAVLAAIAARGMVTAGELRRRLDLVHDTARVAIADVHRTLAFRDSLEEELAAGRDRVSELLLTRDSLRNRLAARVAATPIRPLAPPAPGCERWAQYAEALALDLAAADDLLRADSATIGEQGRNLARQRFLSDSLAGALVLAGRRLEAIDTIAPRAPVVVINPPGLVGFGEAALSSTGWRATAGLRWRSLFVDGQATETGTRLEVGVRREVRIF